MDQWRDPQQMELTGTSPPRAGQVGNRLGHRVTTRTTHAWTTSAECGKKCLKWIWYGSECKYKDAIIMQDKGHKKIRGLGHAEKIIILNQLTQKHRQPEIVINGWRLYVLTSVKHGRHTHDCPKMLIKLHSGACWYLPYIDCPRNTFKFLGGLHPRLTKGFQGFICISPLWSGQSGPANCADHGTKSPPCDHLREAGCGWSPKALTRAVISLKGGGATSYIKVSPTSCAPAAQ